MSDKASSLSSELSSSEESKNSPSKKAQKRKSSGLSFNDKEKEHFPKKKKIQSENLDRQERNSRQIEQLEETIKKCQMKIRDLQEKEVDFDDDQDSAYIQEDRYKKKVIQLCNYLSEIGGDRDMRKQIFKKKVKRRDIPGVMTGNLLLDEAVIRLINSGIGKINKLKYLETQGCADLVKMPDYVDILQCIKKCNRERNLGFSEEKMTKLAKRAFKDLGNFLKTKRINESKWYLQSLVPDESKDPAEKDVELRQKLQKNKTDGDKRLKKIFKKYLDKQDGLDPEDTEEQAERSPDDENKDKDETAYLHSDSKNENNNREKNKSYRKEKGIVETNIIAKTSFIHVHQILKSKETLTNNANTDTARKYKETLKDNIGTEATFKSKEISENKAVSETALMSKETLRKNAFSDIAFQSKEVAKDNTVVGTSFKSEEIPKINVISEIAPKSKEILKEKAASETILKSKETLKNNAASAATPKSKEKSKDKAASKIALESKETLKEKATSKTVFKSNETLKNNTASATAPKSKKKSKGKVASKIACESKETLKEKATSKTVFKLKETLENNAASATTPKSKEKSKDKAASKIALESKETLKEKATSKTVFKSKETLKNNAASAATPKSKEKSKDKAASKIALESDETLKQKAASKTIFKSKQILKSNTVKETTLQSCNSKNGIINEKRENFEKRAQINNKEDDDVVIIDSSDDDCVEVENPHDFKITEKKLPSISTKKEPKRMVTVDIENSQSISPAISSTPMKTVPHNILPKKLVDVAKVDDSQIQVSFIKVCEFAKSPSAWIDDVSIIRSPWLSDG